MQNHYVREGLKWGKTTNGFTRRNNPNPLPNDLNELWNGGADLVGIQAFIAAGIDRCSHVEVRRA